MSNINKLKLIYSVMGLALALSLGGCDPAPETEVLIEQDNDTSASEMATEQNSKLPKDLPEDFPWPDDVEITMSISGQDKGKKYVLLMIRTKEDMGTITSMYTTYLEGRKLEDAAQTLDAKNIIIQGESPTNSEYWSIIGGTLASEEGVIKLTINWEEL